MRRDGWSLRSSLWFVLLVALGLRVATGTWDNFKRSSVEYHRWLSYRCGNMSAGHLRLGAIVKDESSSRSVSDPAAEAGERQMALWLAQSARSYSLQAASLAEKAELCERSRVGWIFLQYETSRNPPDLPVQHSSGGGKKGPWVEQGTPLYSILVTLAHVDFLGLAGLALAIVLRRRFARARGVGGRPAAPTAA